ncbi:MAG: ArdC-like ssDNA-binding domain-containing protein [Waterburya sp.]
MPKTKKSNTQKLDKRFGIVTERIIELIAKGTVPWHKPWKNIGFQNLFSDRPLELE